MSIYCKRGTVSVYNYVDRVSMVSVCVYRGKPNKLAQIQFVYIYSTNPQPHRWNQVCGWVGAVVGIAL